MLVYDTLQIGKQCMCSHKHEKSPKTAFAERVSFLLVEAPPQSPANTKCVLKHSSSNCGYAILRIAGFVQKELRIGHIDIRLFLCYDIENLYRRCFPCKKFY